VSYDSEIDPDDVPRQDAKSDINWLDMPKYNLKYPELFLKDRRNLGNIIINRMKTTGGTDIDWLIEHNGHFMIFELKHMNDGVMTISKALMQAFEFLYKKLEQCHFFLIGYDEADFTKPDEHIWFLEFGTWIINKDGIKDKCTNPQIRKKYIIEKKVMNEITVHQLRSIIDATWEDMK
jgi:hypothetical protein